MKGRKRSIRIVDTTMMRSILSQFSCEPHEVREEKKIEEKTRWISERKKVLLDDHSIQGTIINNGFHWKYVWVCVFVCLVVAFFMSLPFIAHFYERRFVFVLTIMLGTIIIACGYYNQAKEIYGQKKKISRRSNSSSKRASKTEHG